MPPTALATTGRAFHIASVTVSPKPSRRLFCTTTAACRWSALTIAAFSCRSSIGRLTRCTRSRCSSGSPRQRSVTSWNTSAPSGSSATASTLGPTSISSAEPARGLSR